MTQHFTAEAFIKELSTMQSREQLKAYERYFPLDKRNGDTFIGVKMGHIFTLAKRYKEMELHEIEKLLENPVHEMRVGAVSIMDYQAREKKVTEEHRKALFDLYLRRHDRINTWDLVDRSAIYVIGQYLADKPKDTLYKLARAGNMAERRTAILSTAYFMMKQKQVDDTIKIAELLLHDNEDLIHKAVGWMLRVAGGVDEKSLVSFLDAHAIEMPRVMLQYATEKLHKEKKAAYMRLKQPK